MKIDIRDGARPVFTVAAYVLAATLVRTLGPQFGVSIPDGTITDGLSAAMGAGLSIRAFRPLSLDSRLYPLQQALRVGRGRRGPDISIDSATKPADMHGAKTETADGVPMGLVAKYWIITGRTPEPNESVQGILEKLEGAERAYGDNPRLSPEMALRIAGALTELLPEEVELLKTPSVEAEWQSIRLALEQRMTEAHFHRVLLHEERARLRRPEAMYRDLPTEADIACYFVLTGHVPSAKMRGSELNKALQKMQRHRARHIDPLTARAAVTSMLRLQPGHPALLPIDTRTLPPDGTFPYKFSDENADTAALRYNAGIQFPESVQDAFVGRDGWHYMKIAGKHRGDDAIAASRGSQYSTLVGRAVHIDERWHELVAERCTERLSQGGETDSWSPIKRANLEAQHETASAMKDAPQHIWPEDGAGNHWERARNLMETWAHEKLPRLPRARRVQGLKVSAHLTSSRVIHASHLVAQHPDRPKVDAPAASVEKTGAANADAASANPSAVETPSPTLQQ